MLANRFVIDYIYGMENNFETIDKSSKPITQKNLLTVQQYSYLNKVTTSMVYQWLKNNRLPGAECIDGHWVISKNEPRPEKKISGIKRHIADNAERPEKQARGQRAREPKEIL